MKILINRQRIKQIKKTWTPLCRVRELKKFLKKKSQKTTFMDFFFS